MCQKKILKRSITAALAAACTMAPLFQTMCHAMSKTPPPIVFEASDESLNQYETPEWFADAKFGIFLHWGMASEMAVTGWYSKWMYKQQDQIGDVPDWAAGVYTHHVNTYGHPSKVGFKDLTPLWKAQNWNPDELVGLFKKIGAKYIVPMANHHDNFDNWDSSHQEWNSVNIGPKRDIIGDWGKSIRKHGLYFGASTHAARSWRHNQWAYSSDSTGPLAGVPYDGVQTKEDGKGLWWEGYDPEELYGRKLAPGQKKAGAYFLEKWVKRTTELYDKYDLDLLWFDGKKYQHPDQYREVIAGFYNANMKKRGGKLTAVASIKSPDDPKAVVADFEKGVASDIKPYPWQTDTPLSSWYYSHRNGKDKEILKPAPIIIDMLADIVSKNGNLLLNAALRGDGTLPDDQRHELEEIGKWLDINGEAIYATRPWVIYGEGPTKAVEGHYKEFNKKDEGYTSEDVRFTQKPGALYAIVLDWPEDRNVLITSLASQSQYLRSKIRNISLLGSNKKLSWTQTDKGLQVKLPVTAPSKHAFSLKIEH